MELIPLESTTQHYQKTQPTAHGLRHISIMPTHRNTPLHLRPTKRTLQKRRTPFRNVLPLSEKHPPARSEYSKARLCATGLDDVGEEEEEEEEEIYLDEGDLGGEEDDDSF
jgi:hypothetical protein